MHGVKVLLVEDDLALNMALQAYLEDIGAEVICVSSGPDAIEALNQIDYTVLLTDIDLGSGPDGFDVARHARKLYPRLPVVYVSGTMVAHHAANGVTDSLLVAKPFEPRQIAAALGRVMGREAA